MNSVHEPGPNRDSETIPSRKPGRKTKPGARAPNWPSQCAQAAPRPRAGGRVVAGPGRVVAGPPGRVAASATVSQRPCRVSPCTPLGPGAPSPAPAHPARLLHRVVGVCAHRHGSIVACLATQPKPPHHTGWPTVLQYTPAPSRPVLQYTLVMIHSMVL